MADVPYAVDPGKTSPRMFADNFSEFFSKATPMLVAVVYVPLILGMLGYEAAFGTTGPLAMLGLTALGVLVWTFTEYTLHRWLFHYIDERPWVQRMHYLIHGVHHNYPNDFFRLVLPVLPSIILAAIFFGLFYAAFGAAGRPLFAGFVLGYMLYDLTHFAIHYVKNPPRYFRPLWKHHLVHHFAPGNHAFGVSTRLWDVIFRTMPKADARATPPSKG